MSASHTTSTTSPASSASPANAWLGVVIDAPTGMIVGHTLLPLSGPVLPDWPWRPHDEAKVERCYRQSRSANFGSLHWLLVGRPTCGRTFSPSVLSPPTGQRQRGPQRNIASQRRRRAQTDRRGPA